MTAWNRRTSCAYCGERISGRLERGATLGSKVTVGDAARRAARVACPQHLDLPAVDDYYLDVKTHGLSTKYNHGCRCRLCTLAHRVVIQDFDRRRAGKQAQPAKTAAWREAVEQGVAVEFADRIVHVRPSPDDLLLALLRLDEPNARKL